VRVEGEHVSGVIDWTDACLGDPALDLAWALYDTSREFADGVRTTYPVTDELAARARDWHLLGPWYEVLHGVAQEQSAYVDSGLTGVVTRLRA
jgi:aminoglycoside phosphotransferase (APT) family kinase protein